MTPLTKSKSGSKFRFKSDRTLLSWRESNRGLPSTRDVGTLRGMDVSRWAIDLKHASADRRRPEDLVPSGDTSQKLVPHTRIALLSDGMRLDGAIAQNAGVSLRFVGTAAPDRIIENVNEAKRASDSIHKDLRALSFPWHKSIP